MENGKNFKTKRGLNTMYAFACGYIEQWEMDADNRATLELDSIFHVKGFLCGVRFWEVFKRNELKKARQFFASIKRQAKSNCLPCASDTEADQSTKDTQSAYQTFLKTGWQRRGGTC